MPDTNEVPELTLDDAIKNLESDHLLCRDFGHRWSLQNYHARVVEWANGYEPVVERIVRCTVCRTKRIEQIRRRDGEMIRRNYVYPEGYRFPAGVAGRGGMAKAPFRVEWIKRANPEEADDE